MSRIDIVEVRRPIRWRGAAVALWALFTTRDPAQGAVFLEATEGRSGWKAFDRFRSGERGAKSLGRRQVLRERLNEMAALAALPEGSVGRAFHDFMSGRNLNLEYLEDLGTPFLRLRTSDEEHWFRERVRDMHDLRHLVTGYGADDIGELCLLAFRYAQTPHLGYGVLSAVSALHFSLAWRGDPVLAAVREAYRRGKAGAWMEDVCWEDQLERPLDDLRAELKLQPPTIYNRIMAAPGRPGSRVPFMKEEAGGA